MDSSVMPDLLQVRQIAVCSVAEAGHMGPILRIFEVLAKRGHRVVIYVLNWQADKLSSKAKAMGVELVALATCFENEAAFMRSVKASDKTMFIPYREALLEPLREALSANKPDVVLADFMTAAAQEVASELQVPLVINVPGPTSMVANIVGMPDPNTVWIIGGVEIGRQRFTDFGKALFTNARGAAEVFGIIREHLGGSVVLINSWLGLEKPLPLPAHFRLTGPLLPPATSLVEDLQRGHPELWMWLNKLHALPVVYVTTGSLVQLMDWQVEALYCGLKRANVRVVWSLKEPQQAFLPRRDDPDFWIASWLPQAELMQCDAIVAVMSHCGWGGVLETTTAGRPVVCLPFFADQPANAKILVDAGMGELTAKLPPFAQRITNLYKPGDLTADSIAAAVEKVVRVPSYRESALRVKKLAGTTRGAVEAAWEVELAATFGVEHLLARDRYSRRSGSNIWSGALGLGAFVTAFAALALLRSRR